MSFFFLKKPTASHITSHKIQKTSLFSILHRFSSIFLTFLFLTFIFTFSLSTQIFSYFITTNYFIFFLLGVILTKFSVIFSLLHITFSSLSIFKIII